MNAQTKPQTPVGGPLGDTGDGETGVPEFEQGISNRPSDRGGGRGENTREGENIDVDLQELEEDAADDAE